MSGKGAASTQHVGEVSLLKGEVGHGKTESLKYEVVFTEKALPDLAP